MLGELDRNDSASNDALTYRAIAEGYQTLRDIPGLKYAARYERARNLLKAGDRELARQLFAELYAETLKAGVLPPIDASFREAFQDTNSEASLFGNLMRRAAADLARRERHLEIIMLARQAHDLGDQLLADELLGNALTTVPAKDQQTLRLASIGLLCQTKQLARIDVLLHPLLADVNLGQHPGLWRLGAAVAQQQGLLARAAAYLDKALDLEYRNLPPVVNLATIRADYGKLLADYREQVKAVTLLETDPPKDLLARVIRAADRWRSLDSDSTAACQAAARILQTLGAKELAWDYLTTPIGLQPNEADPWLKLAQALQGEGDFDLADRAYTLAFAGEATNAQILWDRAQNLQQAGRIEQARQLYRQLADGTWQPRFQGLQQQARWLVNR
jgi:predicted Zn-dependent protease